MNLSRAKLPKKTRTCKGGRARVRNWSGSDDEGQALVETALVMPVILIAVTGILVFGIFLNQILSLTEGVGNAGRVLADSGGLILDPCATAATAFQNSAPSLNPKNLSYSLTLNPTPGSSAGQQSASSTTGANFTCASTSTTTGDAGALVSGGSVTLQVTYSNCSLTFYGNKLLPNGCSISQSVTEAVQ